MALISVDNGILMKVWSCFNKDHYLFSLQEDHSNNGYVIGIVIFLVVQKPAKFQSTQLALQRVLVFVPIFHILF